MKTRDFLWGMLASMFLVGCSQNEDAPGMEDSKDAPAYVAVNINFVKDGMSRAAVNDTGFEEGNEHEVENACFFFFDNDGNAYDVSQRTPGGNAGNNQNPRATNYVQISILEEGADDNPDTGNIEYVLKPVIVIHTKDGKYPTEMVTVLNLPNTPSETLLNKSELMDKLETYSKIDAHFVMSNSVYLDDNKIVNSSTLSQSNLQKEENLAKQNAVEVYVERLAAKVTVGLDSNADSYKSFADSKKGFKVMDTSKDPVDQMKVDIDDIETPVYVKILGWELNTTIDKSYLVKNIDDSWDESTIFTGWNDETNKRSYWAELNESGKYTTNFDWDGFTALDASSYCNENPSNENTTKVLVKAILSDVDGNALDLYKWAGRYYSLEKLKEAVAGSLNVFDASGNKITATSIKIIKGWDKDGNGEIDGDINNDGNNTGSVNKIEYYKVYFGLDNSNNSIWYKDNTQTVQFSEAELTTLFESIAYAYAWENGKTYYYTDIKHFENKIGVIRNHHYKVTIQGVNGLGTPVVGEDPNDPDIPEVVTPDDEQHYIAAKINILSWKVVENDVTLGK